MKTLIQKYINQCKFGKSIFRDYYGKDNIQGYLQDLDTHDTAKAQCKNILKRLNKVRTDEFIQACKNTWGGRLELVCEFGFTHIEYTAGQFGTLEMPQAMSAVLQYIEHARNINKN